MLHCLIQLTYMYTQASIGVQTTTGAVQFTVCFYMSVALLSYYPVLK